MKPILRKIDTGVNYSFSIREDIYPFLYNHWHYHPEAELTIMGESKPGADKNFPGWKASFEEPTVFTHSSNGSETPWSA